MDRTNITRVATNCTADWANVRPSSRAGLQHTLPPAASGRRLAREDDVSRIVDSTVNKTGQVEWWRHPCYCRHHETSMLGLREMMRLKRQDTHVRLWQGTPPEKGRTAATSSETQSVFRNVPKTAQHHKQWTLSVRLLHWSASYAWTCGHVSLQHVTWHDIWMIIS